MNASFVLLPGDGIGPEVTAAAHMVLVATAQRFGHSFEFDSRPMGGNAIDDYGDPLPQATLEACQSADAVILGAVGGPKWDDPDAKTRPEAGLLGLRKELGLFANLRPITAHQQLISASPLRRELIEGVDILFFRELTGGIYFGRSSLSDDGRHAESVMEYTVGEIERIVRMAATAARNRAGHLTSVDKANVLEVSRLWRRVAARVVADEFPDISYEVVLVDAMAMHLISRPRDFDVVVTGNLFGDILTDEGSMLPGSLGMLPSASLGERKTEHRTTGMYEPIHGSSPAKTGLDIANPTATILSAAMMLRWSLGQSAAADAIETAVRSTLDSGTRTRDLMGSDGEARGWQAVGTAAFSEAVARQLASS